MLLRPRSVRLMNVRGREVEPTAVGGPCAVGGRGVGDEDRFEEIE